MNELKHTPGPWIDGNTSDSIIRKPTYDDEIDPASEEYYGGIVICESVDQYNKALIKAAPEMLEALINILKNQGQCVECEMSCGKNPDMITFCEFKEMKLAVESATGMKIEEVLKAL